MSTLTLEADASAAGISPDAVAIHVSDVISFLGCRRKWDWSSMLGRGLEPNRLYAPFFLGRMVHDAHEHLYAEGIHPTQSIGRFLYKEVGKLVDQIYAYQKSIDATFSTDHPRRLLWPEERINMRDQVKLGRAMMSHYALWVKHYKGPFCDDELEFLSHERPFRVPLLRDDGSVEPLAVFEGRFDGLVRSKIDGSLWLWELKTARSVNERINMLPNDLQATAYCQAAQQVFGEPVAGVIYTIMRKKAPATPNVLYNGFLSTNKNMDTTPYAYAEAIKKHHGPMARDRDWVKRHYGEMIANLRMRENQAYSKTAFFRRVAVRRTPEELVRFRGEFWRIAMEMINPYKSIYATPGYHCSFCFFRDPCLAYSGHRDHELLLAEGFRRREYVPTDLEIPLEEEGTDTGV